MERRRVRCVTRDHNGDITAIGNATEVWRRRSLNEAIDDISLRGYSYYVEEKYPAVNVRVVDGKYRKHLQTVSDSKDPNNLDNLPTC